ncbi:MAG: DNA polymerase III subunit alpha, partial [Myxococcota bacterium]
VAYITDQVHSGLEARFREMPYEVDRDKYAARLKRELDIIVGMKFPGYFLIVADFINWAKANDIPVGPGRGSGAGSLVAYCLRITDLDPLPYNLLFERFLNPERVSMPDFDVDFCQERRGEVIDYVTDKYGSTRVGQIATYAQMKAKSVIKDVARCLELPFNEVNALTKLLPAMYKDAKGSAKPITIDKALQIEPQLRQLVDSNETYAEVIEIAKKLENLYRQAGMHAAGIVIGNDDLWNIVPVFRGNDGELVTQFSMVDVEDAGLVKFDFLGLKTLDVIYHAERHVNDRLERELAAGDVDALYRHRHIAHRVSKEALRQAVESKTAYVDRRQARPEGIDLTLRCSLLPLADPEVYKLIGRGETLGVFQLESTGFQELLKRLKPDCFEDIVAAVALYRPGPLQTGMVDDFINCKHGRKQIEYPHPTLEHVLKPTYGGFVYQEQVMQAAQVMAGYSLGGADLLRRAMGKKKMEVMAKERVKFVAGCEEKSIPEPEATRVFDLMEKFAGYGFNKSHSAAYALVTFQTAYLKSYYKVEFMAALLSTEVGSTENIVKYIAEARSMGIEVLPPTVNESDKSFTVPGGKIRFGLSAIKGLGDAALQAVLDARTQDGDFTSLYDFCERVPLRQINKKTMETLVRSGAFDCFDRSRAQLMDALERAIDAARSVQRSAEQGQGTLFGAPELAHAMKPKEIYDEDLPEWRELEKLQLEKDAVGFYLSGHPIKRYAQDLVRMTNGNVGSLERRDNGTEVVLGTVVTAIRERPLRDGSGRLAFVTFEDLTGQAEAMASADVWQRCEHVLKSDRPILVKLRVSKNTDVEGNVLLRLRVLDARMIDDVRQQRAKAVVLRVNNEAITERRLTELKKVFTQYQGPCGVRIVVRLPETEVEMALPGTVQLAASDEMMDRVEQLFGYGTVIFQ